MNRARFTVTDGATVWHQVCHRCAHEPCQTGYRAPFGSAGKEKWFGCSQASIGAMAHRRPLLPGESYVSVVRASMTYDPVLGLFIESVVFTRQDKELLTEHA